jgi:phycoerythrin-associated linker protein
MNHSSIITVNRNSSAQQREFALTLIYRQVLERQPYMFERQQLAAIEKDFLSGKLGVRRFLRELGCSTVYLEAFYGKFSNMKFLDLCFKHFLGRAIADRQEMQVYGDILTRKGVVELINAILDSEEYVKCFGCFTVPYLRCQDCYQSPGGFLDTQKLNAEHYGQRGRSLPTLYWRELGYICYAGVCRHPEADEILEPLQPATVSSPSSEITPPQVMREPVVVSATKNGNRPLLGFLRRGN